MLTDFILENREEIITRCRSKLSSRSAPRVTELELEEGVPLFLDQFVDVVRSASGSMTAMGSTASKHGAELLQAGYTVGQVVHDYGGICQSVTELAVEKKAPISSGDFKILNLCLDECIAEAVTEYARLRAAEDTERTGRLAHELNGWLHTMGLAFEVLKSGEVGMGGSTSKVIDRALAGMHKVVERELTEVRIGSGVLHSGVLVIRDFLEDIEITATMEAKSRNLGFAVGPIDRALTVNGDRHILTSVVSNLLHNAFKFTRPGGNVSLTVNKKDDRILIEVKDECGGITDGDVECLFNAYEQRNGDISGMGLGLSICRQGARSHGGDIRVVDHPGVGCTFTLDLPSKRGASSPTAS